jgi:hypothetical protein
LINYIIYKTTNNLTGKYYIGVHKQSGILFEGYWGSSRNLSEDIKKLGSSNFYRETLFSFNKEEDAYKKEAEIVNSIFVKNSKTYNKVQGGKGGTFFCINEDDRIEANLMATKTRLNKYGDKMGKANSITSKNLAERTKYFKNLSRFPELQYEMSLLDSDKNILFTGTLYDIGFILHTKRNAVKYRHNIYTSFKKDGAIQVGKYKGYYINKVKSSTTSALHVVPKWARNRIYDLKSHKDIVYSAVKTAAVNKYRKFTGKV